LKLPLHIENLARDLKVNPSTERVLLDHLTDTYQDIGLYQIYLRLGYSPEKAAFQHTPTRLQALQLISEEFGQTKEDEQAHADLKHEFYRTFKENQIDQFSSPASLGLTSVSTCDEQSRGMFDDTSLMDFWGNITPQKPMKIDLEFETPCKSVDLEGRSSKGLRSVSLRVKEILRRKGKSSYKDVADVLVQQLDLPPWADKSKEEKNIRRRVYDALNVLIAAGIMGRDGRDIVMLNTEPSAPSEDDEELKQLKMAVMQKRQKIRELAYNYMGVKQLISRNKLQNTDERIDFPFIVLATEDSPDNSLYITANSTCQKVNLSFKKEAFTIGDSDLVKMMPFQKPWNFDLLPHGVRQLVKESPLCLFA